MRGLLVALWLFGIGAFRSLHLWLANFDSYCSSYFLWFYSLKPRSGVKMSPDIETGPLCPRRFAAVIGLLRCVFLDIHASGIIPPPSLISVAISHCYSIMVEGP